MGQEIGDGICLPVKTISRARSWEFRSQSQHKPQLSGLQSATPEDVRAVDRPPASQFALALEHLSSLSELPVTTFALWKIPISCLLYLGGCTSRSKTLDARSRRS